MDGAMRFAIAPYDPAQVGPVFSWDGRTPRAKRQIVTIVTSLESVLSLGFFITILATKR
jgi:hypothetical protein